MKSKRLPSPLDRMPEVLRRPAPRRPDVIGAILAGTISREAQESDGLRLLAKHYCIDIRQHDWTEKLALALARDFVPYFQGARAGRPQRWDAYTQLILCGRVEQGTARGLTLEQIYEKLAGSRLYPDVTPESLRRRYTQARRKWRGSPLLEFVMAEVYGVPTDDFVREIEQRLEEAVVRKLARSIRSAQRYAARDRARRLERRERGASRAETRH